MSHTSWLEQIAQSTSDAEIINILNCQPVNIQNAYKKNDQKKLGILIGGNNPLPSTQAIFQL